MDNHLGECPHHKANNGVPPPAYTHDLGGTPPTTDDPLNIQLEWLSPEDLSFKTSAVLEGEALPHNSQDFYTNGDISLDNFTDKLYYKAV